MEFEQTNDVINIKDSIMILKEEFCSLFDRVDIDVYCEKISQNACSVRMLQSRTLVGFAAIYLNDIKNREAYITLIGISNFYQKKGYGTKLLLYCEKLALEAGMQKIRLEVDNNNKSAIKFYYSNRYYFESQSNRDSIFLVKDLKLF